MNFNGYTQQQLVDLIDEHESLLHLKGTPAYKRMLAEARVQHLQTKQRELNDQLTEAVAELEKEQGNAA